MSVFSRICVYLLCVVYTVDLVNGKSGQNPGPIFAKSVTYIQGWARDVKARDRDVGFTSRVETETRRL